MAEGPLCFIKQALLLHVAENLQTTKFYAP